MKKLSLLVICIFALACSKTEQTPIAECPVYVSENMNSSHSFLDQNWRFQFYSDNGPFQYAPCIFKQNTDQPEIVLKFSLDSTMVYPTGLGFERLEFDYEFSCGPKSLSGTYSRNEKDELEMDIYPIQTMEFITDISPYHSELAKRTNKVTSYKLQHNILQLHYPGGYMQFAAR